MTIGSYAIGIDLAEGFNSLYVRFLRPDLDFDVEFVQGIGARDALFPSGAAPSLNRIADRAGVIPDTSLPTDAPPLSSLRPFEFSDQDTLGCETGLDLLGDGNRLLIELSRLERVPEPEITGWLVFLGLALAALRRRAW